MTVLEEQAAIRANAAINNNLFTGMVSCIPETAADAIRPSCYSERPLTGLKNAVFNHSAQAKPKALQPSDRHV